MKELSSYEGFVETRRVCQGMNGLSRLKGFVKIRRGLSRYEGV